jgi:ferrous iron transport protein A
MKAPELQTGEKAIITAVGGGPSGRRLREMGFLPGRVIVLTGKGPFGDPLAFESGLMHAALRKEEAELLEVQKISNP